MLAGESAGQSAAEVDEGRSEGQMNGELGTLARLRDGLSLPKLMRGEVRVSEL